MKRFIVVSIHTNVLKMKTIYQMNFKLGSHQSFLACPKWSFKRFTSFHNTVFCLYSNCPSSLKFDSNIFECTSFFFKKKRALKDCLHFQHCQIFSYHSPIIKTFLSFSRRKLNCGDNLQGIKAFKLKN